MFDHQAIFFLKNAVEEAIVAAAGAPGSELKKQQRLTVSMSALIVALEKLLDAPASAEQALAAASALGVTRSMGTIHRHMTLARQRRKEEADSDATAPSDAETNSNPVPPDIAALVAQARTALDQISQAVPAALAADRRTHNRYHSEELERLRDDHERRLAELRQDLLESRSLAEACIADADESAETASSLQLRNDSLSRELEAATEECDRLRENNTNLQRMRDEDRSAAREAHTAAATSEQQVRNLRERVEELNHERKTLKEALENARETKALAEGRSEQLQGMVKLDRERLAHFDKLMGESMVMALRLTQNEKERDATPTAQAGVPGMGIPE